MRKGTTEITNDEDVIDSRDVITRIEELQDLIDDNDDEETDTSDEKEELAKLLALQEEAQGSPHWIYGEALIRDSYFKKYAEQLADDIGAIDRKASWPLDCIDWEKAAKELQFDYMEVDFDGVSYWIRA